MLLEISEEVQTYYDEQVVSLEELARKEREDLGLLLPEEVQIEAVVRPEMSALGTAQGSRLRINVALNTEYSEVFSLLSAVQTADTYFSSFEAFIKDPEGVYDVLKESNRFKKLYAFSRECGRDVETIFSNLSLRRENLINQYNAYVSSLPKPLINAALLTFRHEYEHVAQLRGTMHVSKPADFFRLEQELFSRKLSQEKSEYVATVHEERLQKTSFCLPIIESLAHVFSETTYGKIMQTDPVWLKEKLFSCVTGSYQDSFLEQAAHARVSRRWADGTMNRDTSNSIFYIVNKHIGLTPNTYPQAGIHSNADVVESVGNQLREDIILYQDIARKAADAVAFAFTSRPERVNNAIFASSIDEFVDMCRYDS
ncbi:MAG: hypothetical protein ACMXYD_01125 [Candidatus Woesearchaeota archaeon]